MYLYILIAVCLALTAFCIKKQNEMTRHLRNQAIQKGIESIVEQDSDEERKQRILQKIRKVGIYQCDSSNLHLR